MSLSTSSYSERSGVDIFRSPRYVRDERDVNNFRILSPHQGRNDRDVFRSSSQNGGRRNERDVPVVFARSNNSTSPFRDTPLRDTNMPDEREPLERQSLPSIRTAIPELDSSAPATRPVEADYVEPRNGSNSEYVASSPRPKRQRLSLGRERDFGELATPRGFDPIYRPQSVAISPTNSTFGQWNASSASDSLIGSNRSSPHGSMRGLPAIRTSISHNEMREIPVRQNPIDRPQEFPRRLEMHMERRASYVPEIGQMERRTSYASPMEPFPSTVYQQPAMPYAYHQQQQQHPQPHALTHHPRGQSYSGPSGSSISHDRTPFWNNHHNVYPGSTSNYGVADSGENKQRKRRGNLPKETTDKLRTWFVGHLSHPYPTEDEKQELMRQTGLQISMPPIPYLH